MSAYQLYGKYLIVLALIECIDVICGKLHKDEEKEETCHFYH